MFRRCTIGSGATEEAAWLDALGPKPWSDHAKKMKKKYNCRKLDEDEEPRYSDEP